MGERPFSALAKVYRIAGRYVKRRAVRICDVPLRVREKPFWLKVFNRRAAVALLGTVYLPGGFRARHEGTARFDDVLDHESIHVARQHAAGMLRWHLLYALSRRFRWEEEKAAYRSELRRLRARGEDLAPEARERLAAELAGAKYLYMTDAATARAFIDEALREPAPPPAI